MTDKKTEALELALEYRPTMPLAVLHSWAGDMKKSAQKALAEQPAQQYNATSDPQLMEMTKIGCVNHDCDQCKYKYDCDKAEQPTVKQSLTVEPVAWRSWNDHDGYGFWETKQEAEPWCAPDFFAEPLYTSPPAPKPWVGLTKQEIDKIYRDLPHPVPHWQLSRAIEAKLREKNNG